jgi:hypothetical protein
MAAKTYKVAFQVDGAGAFQNDARLFNEYPELKTAMLNEFRTRLKKKYPEGALSGDDRTFTTTVPVETIKIQSFFQGAAPDKAAFRKYLTKEYGFSNGGSGNITFDPISTDAPAPAPKTAAPTPAPTAAPPVVTSTGPKTTYTLGFQVNCAGTFQRDGGIQEIFGGELDAALLKSFRGRLKKLFPDGEYGKNDTTFTTSGDVTAITMDRDEEGHNKLYIESLLPEGPLRTQLTDSMSCGEDENTGEILLLPITGGKRRKTRRSTRRKRTTRRR